MYTWWSAVHARVSMCGLMPIRSHSAERVPSAGPASVAQALGSMEDDANPRSCNEYAVVGSAIVPPFLPGGNPCFHHYCSVSLNYCMVAKVMCTISKVVMRACQSAFQICHPFGIVRRQPPPKRENLKIVKLGCAWDPFVLPCPS